MLFALLPFDVVGHVQPEHVPSVHCGSPGLKQQSSHSFGSSFMGPINRGSLHILIVFIMNIPIRFFH